MPLLEEDEHSSELFTKKTLEDAKTGEDEEPERWLEIMGAEKSEIKRLQSSQVILQDFIIHYSLRISNYTSKYISRVN